MRIKALTVLLLMVCAIAFGQNQRLYKIINQKKYGFVDVAGTIKIAPKYNFARQFKEGLAAVRENDKYGFIDEQGNYVIAPQYEMAESFSCGLAVVYTKGKPMVINKQNKIIVDTVYNTIKNFENGYALVSHKKEVWGVIDSLGNEIIKPKIIYGIFFDDEYAVVRNLKNESNFYDNDYGVIDRKYQTVLPFGKYWDIEYYGNDFFFVRDKDGNHIVSKYGKEILRNNKLINYHMASHFNNGLAFVDITEKPGTKQERTYSCIVDTSGTIVFRDNIIYQAAIIFNGKIALVQQKDGLLWGINKRGEKKFIDSIQSVTTLNNVGFIYKNKKDLYGLLDTNGNIIAKPNFSYVTYEADLGSFYFYEGVTDSATRIGLCDVKGNITYLKDYNEINIIRAGKDGLIYQLNEDENTIQLLNNQLKTVWQTAIKNDSLTRLNIDFKYQASYEQERQSYNFKDAFYNFGKKIKNMPFNSEKGKLSFKIFTNVTDTFVNGFISHPLYLFNNTQSNLTYLSIDFEAPIILQAKNERGIWKDIATIKFYHGHYTNTYMKSTLSPNAYLKFPIPIFEGAFKTKLRVVFEYNIRDDKKYYYEWVTKRLYSNEMAVSINPAQFYNESELHFPSIHTEDYIEMLNK